jgi:four helix bundle protein
MLFVVVAFANRRHTWGIPRFANVAPRRNPLEDEGCERDHRGSSSRIVVLVVIITLRLVHVIVVVALGWRNRATFRSRVQSRHTRGVSFSHQRLAVYRRSIDFVAWSHELLDGIDAPDSARLQLERASTSVPLNIAEGNVKSSPRDRRRYWEIALGSAAECAAILDVLVARRLLSETDDAAGLDSLERIVSMLVRLVQSVDEDGRVARQRRRRGGGDDDKDNEPR